MVSRLAIRAALLERLAKLPGVTMVDPAPRDTLPQVGLTCMVEFLEQQGTSTPSGVRWAINGGIRLDAHDGQDLRAFERLYQALDALDGLLKRQPGEALSSAHTTLGGVVASCHVAGAVDIIEGWGGEPCASAVIPVTLITA